MLAEKLEYYDYPELHKKVEIKSVPEKKVRKSYAVNKQMFLLLTVAVFITSLFILNGYAKITSVRQEITNLEKEVDQLSKIRQELEGNLESLKNTAVVAEQAKAYLGMVYPEEGQITYIAVNASTYEDTYHFSIAEKVKNVLSIFSSIF
ncbi:MAG: septum formation initiator family protein [Gudongella sp.]|nr:septum formation initiator family protein [Gudongella sp.]